MNNTKQSHGMNILKLFFLNEFWSTALHPSAIQQELMTIKTDYAKQVEGTSPII